MESSQVRKAELLRGGGAGHHLRALIWPWDANLDPHPSSESCSGEGYDRMVVQCKRQPPEVWSHEHQIRGKVLLSVYQFFLKITSSSSELMAYGSFKPCIRLGNSEFSLNGWGQPYLAAQIMSKYGKRQVVSVENYTERSFFFPLCWQNWCFESENELDSYQESLFQEKKRQGTWKLFRAEEQPHLPSAPVLFWLLLVHISQMLQ